MNKITKQKLREMILRREDVTNIDVSHITDMSGLFMGTIAFNQDISNWDVSNVTDMSNMFYNCNSFNQDISNWDVSSVKSMRCMFSGCVQFSYDLSKWDVSSVKDMSGIFVSILNTPTTELNLKKESKTVEVADMTPFDKMICEIKSVIGGMERSAALPYIRNIMDVVDKARKQHATDTVKSKLGDLLASGALSKEDIIAALQDM